MRYDEEDEFDYNALSDESKDILNKFYGDLSRLHSLHREVGAPVFYDAYPLFGEKLGQVKGHLDGQKNALKECKVVRNEILALIQELRDVCSQVEDVSMGLVNSFDTEYDCDMFIKGGMYQAKFIMNSKHWSCRGAQEEWKKDYDNCVELFHEVTSGLNVHNFKIFYMESGEKAFFGFTVHGVPGDFEISFPLNSNKYHVGKHWLDSSSLPMQMRLTWRRRWTIPVFDYFFGDFGSYDVSEVNKKLHEFIETGKYMEFSKDSPGLQDEIDACSKEGKKVI